MELLNNKKSFLKKIIGCICLSTMLLASSPILVLAQASGNGSNLSEEERLEAARRERELDNLLFLPEPTDPNLNTLIPAENLFDNGESGVIDITDSIVVDEQSQAFGAINGFQQQGQAAGQIRQDITSAAAGGAASCVIGGAISNIVKGVFTSAAANIAAEKAEDAIEGIKEVPVVNPSANDHLRLQTQKESTALKIFGFPILPSWDAIGYCLINTIIDYITIATIGWINSGFQGNPVFVEDPAQFFQDIADIEAQSFIQQLGGGGHLCEPFNLPIQLSLLRNHVNNYGRNNYGYFNNARCSLSNSGTDISRLVGNNGLQNEGLTSFHNLTQSAYNNPFDSHTLAQNQLDQRIGQQQGYQQSQLNWGNGFLSFKDPETGETTTPGRLIEQGVNRRLGASERRIEMADEFDEIINALVNQLIKIALNETLTSSYNR